ncbi:hypothetical protein ACIBHX_01775 [Nonomuraea sp. NPDC050536]|uniref:hypothetical protein n=1 Tax=Nonomuraea sp. NPDC050536 TaxID=3364366 RepID=UPI0037CCB4DE
MSRHAHNSDDALTPEGRKLERQVAALSITKRFAAKGDPEAREDIDTITLGSERAAKAMRAQNRC